MKFFKPKLTKVQVAESIARTTARTLFDPELNPRVLEPLRGIGLTCSESQLRREVFYLLQFCNQVALMGFFRDEIAGTEVLQKVTDHLIVALSERGLWLPSESVKWSEEYFQRREEHIQAMEAVNPPSSLSLIAHSTAGVTAEQVLGFFPDPDDPILPLARLALDQIKACSDFLASRRIR